MDCKEFMNNEEEDLRSRLLAGRATRDEGLQLYHLVTGRGAAFPPEHEELVIRLCLASEPDRADLKERLAIVLQSLGKARSPDRREAAGEAPVSDERDHQKDAFEYHNKTGLTDMDPAFLPIYERSRKYSMTSAERMYALYKAVNYITDAGIEGDFVECGVWRGGSMMVAAGALLARGDTGRHLHLFDTYEGLPKPDTDKDVDIWGNRAIDGWLPNRVDDEASHWAEASIEEVTANLLSTGYPADHLHFVKGLVERTIPQHAPGKIALLRLDTDWYESTKHELEHLYERLSLHGVLIIDDYGHFKGARQAVDEYFESRRIPALLNRIDYTGRLLVKTH